MAAKLFNIQHSPSSWPPNQSPMRIWCAFACTSFFSESWESRVPCKCNAIQIQTIIFHKRISCRRLQTAAHGKDIWILDRFFHRIGDEEKNSISQRPYFCFCENNLFAIHIIHSTDTTIQTANFIIRPPNSILNFIPLEIKCSKCTNAVNNLFTFPR